jgi:sugar transferase (PEP-CTERM/EpsH1 system associated)
MMQVRAQVEDVGSTTNGRPPIQGASARDRLRVLHVIPHLFPGGTEYVLVRLIRGLGEAAFEHRICATRGIDTDFAAQNGLAKNQLFLAGHHDLSFQFPLFRLARYMRSFRPHVVHTRNWGGLEAVFAARLAGVPVVIHSEHGYEVDSLAGLPLRRRFMRHVAYSAADAVFTNSRELRDYHARQAKVSLERIQVIYNGVDTNRFAPHPEIRQRVRRELGLSTESFVVGSVGRLVPIKDHGTLLQAASLLAERGIDVRVVLVGTGPTRAELERKASQLEKLSGRVHFVGASDQVPAFLNALDAFVLSSLGEGMSNTLIEAMASGLPTVATRVGGNPELIEEGRTGEFFAPGDFSSLASLLERLSRDNGLRRVLGSAARERAVSCFSFEQMVTNYRALYLEQVARRRILLGRSGALVSEG